MNRNTRTFAAALIGVSALALTACSGSEAPQTRESASGTGYPVTVNSCGVDYTFAHAPERVLLGAPGIIYTLDALGVSGSAIGYTLSKFAAEGIETYPNLTAISADYTPSREFLISAQPDLFLSNDEQQILGDGAASKGDLEAIPANLYVLGDYCVDAPAQSTIDVVYNDIKNLGAIYNVPEKASKLVGDLNTRVQAASSAVALDHKMTAGAVTVSDGKVYALGGSYYAAILDSLGLVNGFAALGSNWSEITPEAVIASDLDVILVTYTGGSSTTAVTEAKILFANTPAARNSRIIGIDDTAFQSVGVAIIDVIEDTARQLADH